ncbi:two-pore potassium channel 3-like [Ipomoea triloba]|uniref:two-pore potassium channel 3-like n=1 Tax=Ipomoea triloba TaxID=35885 RepID=UPI00125D7918|nr:two-pore potassium channel 3-like [Ipomoea triloba]
MEKEPLLSYSAPRIAQSSLPAPISLCPLPEDNEITVPPMSPLEFKDRLIFGSPSPSSTSSSKNPFKDPKSTLDSLDFTSQTFASSSICQSSDQKSNLDLNSWVLDPNHQSQIPCSPSDPKSKIDQSSWFLDSNYPTWSKSNLHRSRTAPAMATINDIENQSSTSKPPRALSIVSQAVVLLGLYLILGVAIYSFFKEHFRGTETHPVVDALYFCIVTMCTIGYGDITPASPATKLFSIMFVLVGFGFIDILLSGMVSYVLDLQETYLLKTIKSRGAHDPGSYIIDVKKGRMRIRMKVTLALGVVVLCIGVGVLFMHYVERLGWLDSLYLSVMSVTTVGYGDRAFESLSGRVFASFWLLVSTLAVARAFLYLAEARVDKRHRMMAKWVLDQDMTVAQFLAADIDNNGFVTKSEYIIYKLKEMGKISEKDILLICKQFQRLDTGNCGRITLADLMEGHH